MRVTVLSHREIAHELGHLEPWLDDLTGGDITRIMREDGLPASIDADLLVVLGSPGSVATGHCRPPAEAEIALVREWVRTDRPYLGICFGAQVLACALGGHVERRPQAYRAYETIPLNDGAPASLAGPWALWHRDAIVRPADAEPLSSMPHADIAFRAGRAWGLQPHIEVSSESFRRMLDALGVAPDESAPILAQMRDDEASSHPPAERVRALLDDFTRHALADGVLAAGGDVR